MPTRFHLLFGEPGNAMQPSCNPAFGVSHTPNPKCFSLVPEGSGESTPLIRDVSEK
jgi:hypothetical protein